MAPEWGRAIRPLVLAYIAFAIVIVFKASMDAQAGAYATGVLFAMASAAVAVTLAVRRTGFQKRDGGLRAGNASARLYPGSQYHRAPRRHQGRLVVHSCHSRRLAGFSG